MNKIVLICGLLLIAVSPYIVSVVEWVKVEKPAACFERDSGPWWSNVCVRWRHCGPEEENIKQGYNCVAP